MSRPSIEQPSSTPGSPIVLHSLGKKSVPPSTIWVNPLYGYPSYGVVTVRYGTVPYGTVPYYRTVKGDRITNTVEDFSGKSTWSGTL